MPARQRSTLIIAFIASVFIIIGAVRMYEEKKQESWPHVIGRITTSKSYYFLAPRRQTSSWRTKFEYEYYVNSIKCVGSTETNRQSKLDAVRAANQNPPETRTAVFYDPNNITKSTLAPGQDFGSGMNTALAGLAFLILSPLLALIVRDKRKRQYP